MILFSTFMTLLTIPTILVCSFVILVINAILKINEWYYWQLNSAKDFDIYRSLGFSQKIHLLNRNKRR